MKTPTPDFSPLTPRQQKLLEEIDGLKKTLADFNGTLIEHQPSEIESTQPDIQDLTLKAARSGLVKRDSEGNWHVHPELPPWARKHFTELVLSRRGYGQKLLRKARIGLEDRLKGPRSLEQLELKNEVLRLRGVKEEDVSGEFGPVVRPEKKDMEQRKKVRKERKSWRQVIRQLVEKQLQGQSMTPPKKLKIPKTPLGLKKLLKRLFPHIDWDKV